MASRNYTSSVRARHAEDTRRTILEAARTLFAEQGYARTSVASVAAAAGVALNTVYASVGGKPALILAVTQDGVDDELIHDTLAQVAELQNAEQIIALVAQRTGEVNHRQRTVIALLLDNRTADPAVSTAAEMAIRLYRERLDRSAERLIAIDGVRPGLDRARVEQILWFYFGIDAWQTINGFGWSRDSATEWLAGQAVAALLPDQKPMHK